MRITVKRLDASIPNRIAIAPVAARGVSGSFQNAAASPARRGVFAIVFAVLLGALVLSPVRQASAAQVPPSVSVDRTEFGSGTTVTVTGANFDPSTAVTVWFDTNGNSIQNSGEPSASATTSTGGSFSVKVLVKSAPGDYRMLASAPAVLASSGIIHVQSCWLDDCFIDDVDTVCILGTSPTESFLGLLDKAFAGVGADCKALDSNFTMKGAFPVPKVTGARFGGAGLLAALTNDLGLCARGFPCLVPGPHLLTPGSGCFAMNAAIAEAVAGGASVPNVLNDPFNADKGLLNIACGSPPLGVPPPFDFGSYVGLEEIAGNTVPDKDPLALILIAIEAATAIADVAVPGSGLTLLLAAQQAIAQAAVAGAIACGHVNYYCDGSDITATMIAKPEVQAARIPLPYAQPPIFNLSTDPVKPNPCPPGAGRCWGGIIGWGKVACTDNTVSVPVVQADGTTKFQYPDGPPQNGVQAYTDVGPCERPVNGAFPMLPVPGSAGAYSSDPLRAPIKCITGTVFGLSIGFDGDVSFDVNDGPDESAPGPKTAELVNYHNFQPGPGGSEAPGGIDIEIPRLDPAAPSTQAAKDAGVLGRDDFEPQLTNLRTGMRVKACGHWVADMHQLWNELHPLTSLTILPPDTTPPATSCGSADRLWHATNVSIACTASDGDSGLAAPADASFSLKTSVPAGTETAAALTDSHEVCDIARNCTTAGPIGPNMVDQKPPTTACGVPDGSWHPTDISIGCAASDGGSGLAAPADASFSLTTSVLAGTETSSALTNSHNTCDIVDNCTTAGPIGPNLVDKKAPAVTISVPAAVTYTINQPVAATYGCKDLGSGVATCAGNVASGSNIDTLSVGPHTFSVNATDNVKNASSLSVTYTVAYNLCLLYDPTKVNNAGNTIPIKLQLCNASGANVSSPSISLQAVGVTKVSSSVSGIPDDSGNANPDNAFRYDAGLAGYIYNLSTKGYQTGMYALSFTASGDPTPHTVQFQLR
jgi:hypothetical protein